MAKRRRNGPTEMPLCYQTPHIEFQGCKFYADRFYLNATAEEEQAGQWRRPTALIAALSSSAVAAEEAPPPPPAAAAVTSNGIASNDKEKKPVVCTCGSQEAPPLFPRESFVNSLELDAAIFGTFALSPEWMVSAFPRLVGPHANVKTLLLHGRKGLKQAMNKATQDDHPETDDEEEAQNNDNQGGGEALDDDRDNKVSAKALAQYFLDVYNLKTSLVQTNCKRKSSSNAHLVTREEVAPVKKIQREYKQGVHHPKFMLLFEKSGSLIVVVTTANLSPTQTVEGTFLQRFEPLHDAARGRRNNADANDFGPVLQDFLQELSNAAVDGNGDIVDYFLSNALGFGLAELAGRFNFSKAQAYLCPVIPGDFPDTPSPSNQFCYGRQRVSQILSRIKGVPKIQHSQKDNSKSDCLLLQPTSLGGNWTRAHTADLVRAYMGFKTDDAEKDDFWVVERSHIIWPSTRYIKKVGGSGLPTVKSQKTIRQEEKRQKTGQDGAEGSGRGSFLFNSSSNFNSCDLEFVSQMSFFENPSGPYQPIVPKVPHFKSIARLFRNHNAMLKSDVEEADAYFSWFLLTSACLSHGAQGVREDPLQPESPVGYRNFELGVLFVSRTKNLPKRGKKVYCCRPRQCCCSDAVSLSSLVNLPVPYSVNVESYFDRTRNEEDDLDEVGVMKETPFFHEIREDSRCVQNMLLTPFGWEQVTASIQDKGAKKRRMNELAASSTIVEVVAS